MAKNNANQSKQAVSGTDNTTTSQGAASTNQSVGDIIAAPGGGVLVLQAGETSVLGLVFLFVGAAWFITRKRHHTEHATTRRLLAAIESNHDLYKSTNDAPRCDAVKNIKHHIRRDGYVATTGGPCDDIVEQNIQKHLNSMSVDVFTPPPTTTTAAIPIPDIVKPPIEPTSEQ